MKMKARWSRAQAAEHVDALIASGKSVEAFAAAQQLPAQRLRYWQKRLAMLSDRQHFSAPPVLLPVRTTPSSRTPIELVFSTGCVVRVSQGFDEETLLQVVELLGRR